MEQSICGTHAPQPHSEEICHATAEQRNDILKKLKCLLNTADYRECVLPDIPINTQRRTHAAPTSDVPNPKRPLITNTGVVETRLTSNPSNVMDDPPELFYKAAPNLKPKRLSLNTLGRKKSVELKGGIFYGSCFCVKRNGLQGDCPRSDCAGRPECLAINPGPCCAPGLAKLGKTLQDYETPATRRPSNTVKNNKNRCKH